MIKKVKPHSEARPSWLNNNGTRHQRSSLVWWWVEFYCPAQSLGLVGGSSVVFEAHRAIRITTRYYHLKLLLLLINFQFINIEHVTNHRTLSHFRGFLRTSWVSINSQTHTLFASELGGGGKYLLQLFSFFYFFFSLVSTQGHCRTFLRFFYAARLLFTVCFFLLGNKIGFHFRELRAFVRSELVLLLAEVSHLRNPYLTASTRRGAAACGFAVYFSFLADYRRTTTHFFSSIGLYEMAH